jgi:hypothetical protein
MGGEVEGDPGSRMRGGEDDEDYRNEGEHNGKDENQNLPVFPSDKGVVQPQCATRRCRELLAGDVVEDVIMMGGGLVMASSVVWSMGRV